MKNEKDLSASLGSDPQVPDSTETHPISADGEHYDASLDVAIEKGALVIRIGIQVLAGAVMYSDWANRYDDEACDYFRDFAISDVQQIAKDVASAMQREEEDGSSLLTHF